MGFGLGLLVIVGALVANALASPIDYVRSPFETRLPLVVGASLAAAFWLLAIHINGARHDFDAMTPNMNAAPDQISAARSSLTRPPSLLMWVAAALAVMLAVSLQEINVARWSRFAAGNWNAFDLWSAVMVMGTMVILYQSLAFVVGSAFAMRRVANLLDVHLFDSRIADPLVRFGLRTVLLFAVLPMIFFGVVLAVRAGLLSTLIVALVINLLVASFCMVVPVQRLRARISTAKQEELDRVECAIAGDISALEDSPMASQLRVVGLVDLLAYRREVEAIPTWPFRGSTVARFVAYVVLPPASWAAAAFVERLIDEALST